MLQNEPNHEFQLLLREMESISSDVDQYSDFLAERQERLRALLFQDPVSQN
jgi:hypothetical protein